MWLLEQLGGRKSTAVADELVQPDHHLLSHCVFDDFLQLGWGTMGMQGTGSSRSSRECALVSWAVYRTCDALPESGAVVGDASSREGAAVGVGVASAANEERSVRIPDCRYTIPHVRTRGQPAGLCKGL